MRYQRDILDSNAYTIHAWKKIQEHTAGGTVPFYPYSLTLKMLVFPLFTVYFMYSYKYKRQKEPGSKY